ncbi:tyrosine-type recombinase/integrase [Aureliella helgolandensis]|uniref:Site-specific tyrosine recombinase XerC n=1 Tax=Aureliella helgolandensis TaxID=2527968 RepID=A0A518G710_9BACT|nr:tyrosine-type recombinase/integrase [Aureliella helgolandensis]QDV24374.1 site-specific tyrosine recombinase XerC [Aureliella helgolandensis]
MLLVEFFNDVYAPHRLRGKSPNSFRLYELTIRQFQRTLQRPPIVEDLTDINVLRHLQRRHEVAAATRNKELAQLSALWRFASQRGLLTTWPQVKDEPEPERIPIAWTRNDIAKLSTAIDEQTGYFAGVPRSVYWRCLVAICLDTGERISAIRAIQWSWIDGQWLIIPAEARKGKTRDRRYRLGVDSQGWVERMRKYSHEEELFPWPYSPTYIWRAWKDVVRAAGIAPSSDRAFHAFRKTVASVLNQEGMDAQNALDHSDRRTTLRYLDPRFIETRQTSDAIRDWTRRQA